MSQPVYLGIDVGGTKLAVGTVTSDGRLLALEKEPVAGESVEILVDQTAALTQRALEVGGGDAPVLRAGVGIPAQVDETGTVRWCPNLPGLNGSPLGSLLEARLGVPVTIGFDGHVGALAEQWVGAGLGAEDLVYIIVGTGIGAGVIANGRLVKGSTGLAGGIGWWVLDRAAVGSESVWPKGFFETQSSGAALREQSQGRWPSPTALLEAAAAGDAEARRRTTPALEYLGMTVANVVSLLHPDVVVLGGGVGARLGTWLPYLEWIVRRFAQPPAGTALRLAVARLGDETGAVGAARLAMLDAEGDAS